MKTEVVIAWFVLKANCLQLVVVRHSNCEVFDKTSNMFVTLETPDFVTFDVSDVRVGSKIFSFQIYTKIVLCYDVGKNEWS